MELGPIQKAWIASLRANPERRMSGTLGRRYSDGTYKACCLGEGGLIAGVCEWVEDRLQVKGTDVNGGCTFYLKNEAYESLGLINEKGQHISNPEFSLSELNDFGKTWPEIADILEKNPEDYFTHSV